MKKAKKKTFIEVKIVTEEKIVDGDIKAIMLITEAMRISTPRMKKANLEFVLNKYNLKVS